MDELRPPVEDFSDLKISFDESKQSFWQLLNEFAQNQSKCYVVGIIALIVCGIACTITPNGWAAVAIVAMVLSFSVFVILNDQKENNSNELGDESPSSGKDGNDQ